MYRVTKTLLALGIAGSFFAIALLPAPSLQARTESPERWLMVSDIHLNPLAEKSLAEELAAEPASEWQETFRKGPLATPSGIGSETNDALLESSLSAMAAALPKPAAILIDGDFLAHNFRRTFDQSVATHDDASYRRFVDKTEEFVALRFSQAFPGVPVLPSIGNNDSYCGNYSVSAGGPFLAQMARIWAPLVTRGGQSSPDFVRDFSAGGHYAVRLRSSRLRVVVPNSVPWSAVYKDACEGSAPLTALDEETWVRGTLARSSPGERTIVMTHIPPGIDTFETLKGAGVKTTFAPAVEGAVERILTSGPPVGTVVAGHFHFTSFRIAGTERVPIPTIILPAISPNYGNAPGFLTAQVSTERGTIDDFTAYALSTPGGWSAEYTFSSSYGLRGVTARSIAALADRIASDTKLRTLFFEHFASGASIGALAAGFWREYRCGSIAFGDPTSYRACIAPAH